MCDLYYFIVQVPSAITTFPSTAQILPEPLGVVLVISAWNYPFCKSMALKIVRTVLYSETVE